MKKVFKILWKVICGYFALNTLAWAFIGSGRFVNDAIKPENKGEGVSNVWMNGYEEGKSGWNKMITLFKR